MIEQFFQWLIGPESWGVGLLIFFLFVTGLTISIGLIIGKWIDNYLKK